MIYGEEPTIVTARRSVPECDALSDVKFSDCQGPITHRWKSLHHWTNKKPCTPESETQLNDEKDSPLDSRVNDVYTEHNQSLVLKSQNSKSREPVRPTGPAGTPQNL